MKRIVLLGSTGSIGQSALKVIEGFPQRFRVTGLSACSNVEFLIQQVRKFRPEFVCLRDEEAAKRFRARLGNLPCRLFLGEQGLLELIEKADADQVLLAISGSSALAPLLKAVDQGCEIALANKEALVMAGPLIMRRARKKQVKIIPIDSEQSAIWQCLEGRAPQALKTIYLTASGGPFRLTPRKDFKDISIRQVLRHPRWRMGKKITVDSATLMNKGLELLEAMFLFDVPCDKIKVVVHPQAIVHSMVEFVDGVVLAQLSATDMRIPIQYALSYPQRLEQAHPGLDFYRLKELNFEAPDFRKFPCLGLAYRAARALGTAPAVLNAANEACVEEFLKGKLQFTAIAQLIQKVLDNHRTKVCPDLGDIRKAHAWARAEALRLMHPLH